MAQELIILSNWSPQDPIIRQSDLGWSTSDYRDAESRDPKDVFNYFWRHAFSIIFYYPDDGNFYELFMEGTPFKFWRIPKKSDWDGKWIIQSIDWNDHREGDVLQTFDDSTDLWNTLKVDGKPIGDVISNSIIAEINY